MAKQVTKDETSPFQTRKADTPLLIRSYEDLVKGLGTKKTAAELSAMMDNDPDMREGIMLVANEKGLYAGNDPEAFYTMLNEGFKKKSQVQSPSVAPVQAPVSPSPSSSPSGGGVPSQKTETTTTTKTSPGLGINLGGGLGMGASQKPYQIGISETRQTLNKRKELQESVSPLQKATADQMREFMALKGIDTESEEYKKMQEVRTMYDLDTKEFVMKSGVDANFYNQYKDVLNRMRAEDPLFDARVKKLGAGIGGDTKMKAIKIEEMVQEYLSKSAQQSKAIVDQYDAMGMGEYLEQTNKAVQDLEGIVDRINALNYYLEVLTKDGIPSDIHKREQIQAISEELNSVAQQYEQGAAALQQMRADNAELDSKIPLYVNNVIRYNNDVVRSNEAIENMPELKQRAADLQAGSAKDKSWAEIIGTMPVNIVKGAMGMIYKAALMPVVEVPAAFDDIFLPDKMTHAKKVREDARDFVNKGTSTERLNQGKIWLPDGTINWKDIPLTVADQIGVVAGLAAMSIGNPSASFGMKGVPATITSKGGQYVYRSAAKNMRSNMYSTVVPMAMATWGDRYDEALAEGKSAQEAMGYASVMSMLEGMSELIMPDARYFTGTLRKKLLSGYVDDLAKGGVEIAKKNLIGRYIKEVGTDAGKEWLEEMFMMGAESGYRGMQALQGDRGADEVLPSMDEFLMTTISTLLVGGVMSGGVGSIKTLNNEGALAKYELATHYNDAEGLILGNPKYSQEQKAEMLKNIRTFQAQLKVLPSDISKVKQAVAADILTEIKGLENQAAVYTKVGNKSLLTITEKKIKEQEAKLADVFDWTPEEEAKYIEETNKAIEEQLTKATTTETKDDEEMVTFTYKSMDEVPDVLKNKVSSSGEINGVPFVRVTMFKEDADKLLNQEQQTKEEPNNANEKPVTEELPMGEQPEVSQGVREEDTQGEEVAKEVPEEGLQEIEAALGKFKKKEQPKEEAPAAEEVVVVEKPKEEAPDTTTKEEKKEAPKVVKEEAKPFTEGVEISRMLQDAKKKYGDKKGAAYHKTAMRLVNPNQNTIVEVRSNGVVVKEGDKFILKPFVNTDMGQSKWELGKERQNVDVTDQFSKKASVVAEEAPKKADTTTPKKGKGISGKTVAELKDEIEKDTEEDPIGDMYNLGGMSSWGWRYVVKINGHFVYFENWGRDTEEEYVVDWIFEDPSEAKKKANEFDGKEEEPYYGEANQRWIRFDNIDNALKFVLSLDERTTPVAPVKEEAPKKADTTNKKKLKDEVLTDKEATEKIEQAIKDSKTPEEAFKKVQAIKGVSQKVSGAFREKYDPEGKLSREAAFEAYYNDVRGVVAESPSKIEEAKAEIGAALEKIVSSRGWIKKATGEERESFREGMQLLIKGLTKYLIAKGEQLGQNLWNKVLEYLKENEVVVEDDILQEFKDQVLPPTPPKKAAKQSEVDKTTIQKVKDYATEVIEGRKEIRRLSQQAEEGRKQGGRRNVEATILLSRGGKESTKIEGREAQQQAVEDYAKQEGIWFDNIPSSIDVGEETILGTFMDEGQESQVFIPKDNPKIVRKAMRTTDPFNKDNPNDVLDFLDSRISEHNGTIGTKYTVVGFGRTSNGEFVVITEQTLIQKARLATRVEIATEMDQLGYEDTGTDTFSDENHYFVDVNPKNVLVDNNGMLHFIDTMIDILSPVNENGVDDFLNNTTAPKKEANPVVESEEEKVRGVQERLLQRGNIQEDREPQAEFDKIAQLADENKETYQVLHLKDAEQQGMEYIKSKGSVDNAFTDLTQASTTSQEAAVRQVARLILIGYYSTQLTNDSISQQDQDTAYARINELQKILAAEATLYGQASAALRVFYTMSPEGISAYIKKQVRKAAELRAKKIGLGDGATVESELTEGLQEEGKAIIEDIEAFLKDPNNKKKVEALLEKIYGKATTTTPKEKIKTAKSKLETIKKKKENLRAKYKEMVRSQFNSVAPLNVILEAAGEFAPLLMQEGYVRLQILSEKLKAEIKDIFNHDMTDEEVREALKNKTTKRKNKAGVVVETSLYDKIIKREVKLTLAEAKEKVKELITEHYSVRDEYERDLAQKLSDEMGLPAEEAGRIASMVQDSIKENIKKKIKAQVKEKKKDVKSNIRKTVLQVLLDNINMGLFTDPDMNMLDEDGLTVREKVLEKLGINPNLNKQQQITLQKLAERVNKYKNVPWLSEAAASEFTKFVFEITPRSQIKDLMNGVISLNYSSMLSGITTQFVNYGPVAIFTINAGYSIREILNPSRWIARFKGRNITVPWEGFTGRYWKAVGDGHAEGFRHASIGMRTGLTSSANKYTPDADNLLNGMGVNELERDPRWVKGVAKLWNTGKYNPFRLAKYVGRFLVGTDAVNTQSTYEAELAAMLYRNQQLKSGDWAKVDTSKKGWVRDLLQGSLIDTKAVTIEMQQLISNYEQESGKRMPRSMVKSMVKQKIRDSVINEGLLTKAQQETAMRLAKSRVFTDERHGAVALLLKQADVWAAKYMPLKVFFMIWLPFRKITANLYEYGMDSVPVYGHLRSLGMSPSSLRKLENRDAKTAQMGKIGTPEFYEQIGRAHMGTVVFLTLAAMLLGSDDDDPVEITGTMASYNKDGSKRTPKLSIRFGNVPIPYMNIPGISIVLSYIGNMNDKIKMGKDRDADFWTKMAAAIDKNVLKQTLLSVKEKTVLKGLSDIIEIISEFNKGGTESAKNKLIGKATSVLTNPLRPNLYRQIALAIDPEAELMDTWDDILKQQAGFSFTINEHQYDIFGREVKYYPGENLVPIKYLQKYYNDPEVRLISKYAVNLAPVSWKQDWWIAEDNVKRRLEDDEYEVYVKRSGEKFREAVLKFIELYPKGSEKRKKLEDAWDEIPADDGDYAEGSMNGIAATLVRIRRKVLEDTRKELGIGGKVTDKTYQENKKIQSAAEKEVLNSLGYGGSSSGSGGFSFKFKTPAFKSPKF